MIIFKTKDLGYLRVQKKNKFYDTSIDIKNQFRKLNISNKSLLSLTKIIKKNKILITKIEYKNISYLNLFFKSGFKTKKVDKNNLIMFKKM